MNVLIQKKTGSGSKMSNNTGSGFKPSEKSGSESKTGHTKLKETTAADFFSSKTSGQKWKILKKFVDQFFKVIFETREIIMI